MKRVLQMAALCVGLLAAGAVEARSVTVDYRGKVLREELVRTDPISEQLIARYVGIVDGGIGFRVSRMRRTVKWHKRYHELVRVTRDPDDPGDSGYSEVVPGEEIAGDLQSEVIEEDLGVLRGVAFALPDGRTLTTDKDGVLSDPRQFFLQRFDSLRPDDLDVTLTGQGESLQLKLSRSDFWKSVGSAERLDVPLRAPRPGELEIVSSWDRPTYRPGDRARLTVTVKNLAEKGAPIGFVKGGRAMSRHPWLDGPVFYVEPIPPEETRSFTREFIIPKDFPHELAHVRIGFNEYSGSKPQHAAILKVRQKD